MPQKKFIGANWKMHSPPAGSFAEDSPFRSTDTTDIVVFPTAVDLRSCIDAKLSTGGQCGRAEQSGAFTGDISMKQLKELGATHVLCGHSERREHHHESNEAISSQVAAALTNSLIPVLCVGETADEHEIGEAENIVRKQLSMIRLDPTIIIAYEPVWAVGTGKTPTPTEVETMHLFIRSFLPQPERMLVIYGGSLNAANAKSFFMQQNIDGALIGGCSLKPDEFRQIVAVA